MAWPRPLHSALAAGEGILDRVLCVVGAVGFSQLPEFMQQYLQRLGGHLDEARRQLEQFRAAAAASGLSIEQLAANASKDADPAVARLGGIVRQAVARVGELSADEQAIRSAPIVARPLVFLRHCDRAIVRATWHAFRPAFPTTLEGLYYGIIGMLFLLCFYHGAVRLPARRVWEARRRRRLAGTAATIVALWAALALPARGEVAPVLSETDAKAAFIFHFTQFVSWPRSAFASDSSPLIIGIAGDERLAAVVGELVRGERMGQHPLAVRSVRDAGEAAKCHMVYLPPAAEAIESAGALKTRPILTIGDNDAFVRDGGIIRFVFDRSRLRLKINVAAARASSLSISARLLRVADVIDVPGGHG